MDCTQLEACLDRLMDGELSQDEQRELDAHCSTCEACAEKVRSTQLMKALLEELPDEIDVPLTAQASWRSAVKEEVRKRRMRTAVRWAGGIAAALAVALGGMFALNRPAGQDVQYAVMEKGVQRIEADGAMEAEAIPEAGAAPETFDMDAAEPFAEANGLMADEAMAAGESIDTAVSRAMPMHEWTVTVEDLDRTCAYMADLVSEYEGTLEEQRYETDGADCANLYIELAAENAGDFLEAAAHYDLDGTLAGAADDVDAEGRVSLLLVLRTGGK